MNVRCVVAAFAIAAACADRAGAMTNASVEPCQVVAVEMMDKVDSSDARPGDFFRFQTINAVTAGNTIVIPARTMGYGVVAIASPAGRNGRAGSLLLEPRYFVLPSGRHLGVVLNHNTTALQRSGPTGNVPGLLGAVPIPGFSMLVGAFNYFHSGKNIVIERGSVFTVFPDDDPAVEACQDHPSY